MLTVPLLHIAYCALAVAEQTTPPGGCSFLQHSLKLEEAQAIARDVETYSLFVKFHKVGGSTWRSYVDGITGETDRCSRDCGYPSWDCRQYWPQDEEQFEHCCHTRWQNVSCNGQAHSCTYHQSLGVMRQALSGQALSASEDLTDSQNLWPSSQRLELLRKVEWAQSWLPPHLNQKRLLVTTILREPAERIRSYYYFGNRVASHEGFMSFLKFRRDFVAGNWTQEQFDKQASMRNRGSTSMSILLRSCCEYETWLGNGSVEQAKLALATQFDLVGVTERMNEGLVSLGKLYGLSVPQLAAVGRSIPHKLDNADNKLDWTDEELALATFIAQKSAPIYALAQELFKQQSVNLFGSEEKLEDAVTAFELLNPQELR